MNVKNLLTLLLFASFLLASASVFSQAIAVGTVTNVHCHGDSTGSISYHISGGTPPIRYVWNTGDSGVSVGGCTYTVRINNPGAALTNFQIRVDVAHASGMTANFSNVVFTDSLSNPIPFWLQDFPTATNATFWVRVPTIPSGASIIYLSFCGSATTSAGNPNTTFEFFDNFDAGSFSSWTQACVTPMAGSSCTASASNTVYYSPGYSAYLSANSTCFTSPYSGAGSTISRTINPIVNDSLVIDYNDQSATTLYGFCSGGTSSANSTFADNVSLGNGRTSSQGGSCSTNTAAWQNETSQPFRVSIGQTTIKLQTYGGDCDNSQGWFDNVRIRKYRAHPPTVVIDTTPQLFLNHLAAGTYTITMTGSNNAVTTSSFVVTQPTAVAPVPDSTNVACYGDATGSTWVASAGGTPPYTYAWSGGQGTDTVTNLAAGVYNITVTDSYGCRDSASVQVIQPSAPLSAIIDSVNVSCYGQSTGQAWAITSGGTPGYTYSWSNSQTTDTIAGLAAGPYSVTVTDAAACTVTAAVNLTQPPSALSLTASESDVPCHGDATGQAWATASGGTAGYQYLWSNTQTTDTISSLLAGSYDVTATDMLGCTAAASVTVNEPATVVSVTTDADNISCKGYTDGKAWATPAGGSPGYSFAWSNSATTDTIRNLSAGAYTVQITDAHGCTTTGAVNILASADTVIIDTAATDATCGAANGSVTLTPSGGSTPYNYTWSTGANTQTLAAVNGGTYRVTVTDAAGCSSARSVSLRQYPAVTASAIIRDDTCSQSIGAAAVSVSTGTPPYLYSWSIAATTASITALRVGSYNATVTDSIACTTVVTATVGNIDIVPQPSLGATDTPICGDAVIVLSPGDFASYRWSDYSVASTYRVTQTGTYSVTVTNTEGCTATVSIKVNDHCASEVLLPTGFSPNNDGRNDLFHAIYTPDLKRFYMAVYNRWGEKIFETSDATQGWDGTYKNVPQPIGTYTWFADYAFDNGTSRTQSGNITLLR